MTRYDYGQVWFASKDQKYLCSPYELQSQLIKPAQPVTISLRTCFVSEDLDPFLSGDNDILITAKHALGERPQTDIVLFYEKEIPAAKPIQSVLSETVFVTNDYSGERLWLEIRVCEIDTDRDERSQTWEALSGVSKRFGAAFPILVPYAFTADTIFRAIEKIIARTRKDTEVLRVPFAFYSNPLGETALTEPPLQRGTYVLFAKEQYGAAFQLDPAGVVLTNTNERARVSYVVLNVDAEMRLSPKYLTGQKISTLLTQLRFNNKETPKNSLDFLEETLVDYTQFKTLERYAELKQKSNRTPEEEARMKEIENQPELSRYLSH